MAVKLLHTQTQRTEWYQCLPKLICFSQCQAAHLHIIELQLFSGVLTGERCRVDSTQPLLKNGGPNVSLAGIRLAAILR